MVHYSEKMEYRSSLHKHLLHVHGGTVASGRQTSALTVATNMREPNEFGPSSGHSYSE